MYVKLNNTKLKIKQESKNEDDKTMAKIVKRHTSVFVLFRHLCS